jgi:predicted lipoprotein with Yx(FWY)xxD motif
MERKTVNPLLLAIPIAIVLAGCGGGSSTGTAAEETAPASSTAATTEEVIPPGGPDPQAMVQVGRSEGIGAVLIDSAHKTLYRFSEDVRGSGATHCYGKCARVWYPKPSAETPLSGSPSIDPSLLGTITRKDGYNQATYDGWPLYTYIREKSWKSAGAGRKAFGGTWYPLRANGESVK